MATGTITIRNPNGRSGTFRVVTIDSNDACTDPTTCIGDLTYVDPKGDSGVVQGAPAIGKIVEAGQSGVYIVIDLKPN